MKHATQTPDWALMIEQLQEHGLLIREIAVSMGAQLTDRMMSHYRAGAQPLHWRGEGLIALWCKTMDVGREGLPQMDLVRGHRVDVNRTKTGPRLQELPDWPKKAAAAVAGIERKKKARETA